MFCPKCGEDLPDDINFCKNCGFQMKEITLEKNYNEKAVYRFFNVIFTLLYLVVFLISIFAIYLGFETRQIISATVTCRDGTTWDPYKPVNIMYNSQALCGLCTKRSNDNKSYTNCEFINTDYNSYKITTTKESWSWNIIIYPIITFSVGLLIVDFLKLGLIYILSGQLYFQESLIIKLFGSVFISSEN